MHKIVTKENIEYVVITRDEFEKYLAGYNENEDRKAKARQHARIKYLERKIKNKVEELQNKELTQEEIEFILEHTS